MQSFSLVTLNRAILKYSFIKNQKEAESKIQRKLFKANIITYFCDSSHIKLITFFIFLLLMSSSVLFASPSLTVPVYSYEDSSKLVIGNSFIELSFDKNDKGGLINIENKITNVKFLSEKAGSAKGEPHLLFYIASSGTHTFQAKEFSYHFENLKDGRSLIMHWKGFTGGDRVAQNRDLNLEITVSITVFYNSPLTYWTLSAISYEKDIDLSSIAFPIISGLTKIGNSSDDDYLVYPALTGLLMKDPLEKMPAYPEIPWQLYPSGCVSMQFLAFYDNKLGGLYIATDDTEGNVKKFSIYRFSMKDWNIAITHLYPFGTRNLTLNYHVIIGVFKGDWYTAADIYKNWAKSQWWCREALKKYTPQWFSEISAIHSTSLYTPKDDTGWNSQIPFSQVPLLAQDTIKTLGMPVIMQVWGWEKHGTFKLIPDYFPPIEGWDSFDKMINGVHNAGGKVSVFIATNTFSTKLPDWERMKQYAIQFPEEQSESEATMCPGSQEWRNFIKNITLTLVRHGVDHIHLDGSLIIPPYPCLNEKHGHPKGYGKWWFESYRTFFAEIREEARKINPEIVFSSEEINELYIPYLDRFYSRGNVWELYPTHWYWQLTNSQAIPLFQYVYHEYISSWGHYVHGWNTGETEYSIKALATSLIWGEPLEIRLPSLSERMSAQILFNPIVQFFKKATRFRYYWGKDFLAYGEMVRPLNISVDNLTITNPHWHLSQLELNQTIVPKILHSAWKNNRNELAFIFVNIGKENTSIRVSINLTDYNLTGNTNIFLVQREKLVYLGNYSNLFSEVLNLSPYDIAMIKVTKELAICIDSNMPLSTLILNGQKVSESPYYSAFLPGTEIEINAPEIISQNNKTRYVFDKWKIGEDGNFTYVKYSPVHLTLRKNTKITAIFTKQYLVTINMSFLQKNFERWYNDGDIITLRINDTIIENGNITRIIFDGWYHQNQLLSRNTTFIFIVNEPITIDAKTKKQHYLEAYSPYSQIEGAGWHNEGEYAILKIKETKIQISPFVYKVFDHWEGLKSEDIIITPGIVKVYVNQPRSLKAFWRTEINYMNVIFILILFLITIMAILIFSKKIKKKHLKNPTNTEES